MWWWRVLQKKKKAWLENPCYLHGIPPTSPYNDGGPIKLNVGAIHVSWGFWLYGGDLKIHKVGPTVNNTWCGEKKGGHCPIIIHPTVFDFSASILIPFNCGSTWLEFVMYSCEKSFNDLFGKFSIHLSFWRPKIVRMIAPTGFMGHLGLVGDPGDRKAWHEKRVISDVRDQMILVLSFKSV